MVQTQPGGHLERTGADRDRSLDEGPSRHSAADSEEAGDPSFWGAV